MNQNEKNMNIILSGASKGIGNAMAKQAVMNVKSGKLYLIARDKKKLEALKFECNKINNMFEVFCIPFDLNELSFEQESISKHIDAQHIDILINNAGSLVNKKFDLLTGKDVDSMLHINFRAPLMLIKELLDRMGGESPTHVLNIGSMGGFQGSSKYPGLSVYSATKAALASLTECLAIEYSNANLFFNCLALGAVQTEMLDRAFPGFKAPIDPDGIAKYLIDFAINGHNYINGKVLPVSFTGI